MTPPGTGDVSKELLLAGKVLWDDTADGKADVTVVTVAVAVANKVVTTVVVMVELDKVTVKVIGPIWLAAVGIVITTADVILEHDTVTVVTVYAAGTIVVVVRLKTAVLLVLGSPATAVVNGWYMVVV